MMIMLRVTTVHVQYLLHKGCCWTAPDFTTACTVHVQTVLFEISLYSAQFTVWPKLKFKLAMQTSKQVERWRAVSSPLRQPGKRLGMIFFFLGGCLVLLTYLRGLLCFVRKIGRHLWGVDLLEVQLSDKISLRHRVQQVGDKGYPLLNRGVNLSEVDLSGEHCIFWPAPGFKRESLWQLYVLTKGGIDFCIYGIRL